MQSRRAVLNTQANARRHVLPLAIQLHLDRPHRAGLTVERYHRLTDRLHRCVRGADRHFQLFRAPSLGCITVSPDAGFLGKLRRRSPRLQRSSQIAFRIVVPPGRVHGLDGCPQRSHRLVGIDLSVLHVLDLRGVIPDP
ncbi:hypothetical protein D9M71_757160 [compost metagenome]